MGANFAAGVGVGERGGTVFFEDRFLHGTGMAPAARLSRKFPCPAAPAGQFAAMIITSASPLAGPPARASVWQWCETGSVDASEVPTSRLRNISRPVGI
jgi:hypothetical protein